VKRRARQLHCRAREHLIVTSRCRHCSHPGRTAARCSCTGYPKQDGVGRPLTAAVAAQLVAETGARGRRVAVREHLYGVERAAEVSTERIVSTCAAPYGPAGHRPRSQPLSV
jgi:hypothetical protein